MTMEKFTIKDIFYSYLEIYPGKADEIMNIIDKVTEEHEGEDENEIKSAIVREILYEF